MSVFCDVAICSTSSDRFVITVELMKDVVRARKYRPLFLVDIAVPRDVDPRVGEMEGCFVYDVDDLQKVADQNIALRKLRRALQKKEDPIPKALRNAGAKKVRKKKVGAIE